MTLNCLYCSLGIWSKFSLNHPEIKVVCIYIALPSICPGTAARAPAATNLKTTATPEKEEVVYQTTGYINATNALQTIEVVIVFKHHLHFLLQQNHAVFNPSVSVSCIFSLCLMFFMDFFFYICQFLFFPPALMGSGVCEYIWTYRADVRGPRMLVQLNIFARSNKFVLPSVMSTKTRRPVEITKTVEVCISAFSVI